MKRVPIITSFKRPIYQYFIKLILYGNDVKFKRSPVYVDLWYVWSVRFWLLMPEMDTSRKTIG